MPLLLMCGSLAAQTVALSGDPTDEAPSDEAKTVDSDSSYLILEGQATDGIGAGVTGVIVRVYGSSSKQADGLIAQTTTSEFGDFSIRTVEPVDGPVRITLEKPAYTKFVHQMTLKREGDTPYLAVELHGDIQLVGLVDDALKHQPIEGASVLLESAYRDWRMTTDEKGRFTVKEWSMGEGWLTIEAKGFARARRCVVTRRSDPLKTDSPVLTMLMLPGGYPVSPEPVNREGEGRGTSHLEFKSGELFTISLPPERVVTLMTVDEQHSPIKGVTVEVLDERQSDLRFFLTDDEGRVWVKGVSMETESLALRLSHDDYVSSDGFDRSIALPADPVRSTHELVLVKAGMIAGKVTAAQTGEAVYGARLAAGTERSDSSPRAWSSYDGSFIIRGVEPGQTIVTVDAADFAPELKTIEVSAEGQAKLDVTLTPAATLRGMVKDAEGQPIHGAIVETTWWREHDTLLLRAITDGAGQFVLNDAPHDEFEVCVFGPAGGQIKKMVKVDAQPVEFTLPSASARGGGLSQLDVGQPAPEVSVTTLDEKSLELPVRGKILVVDFWATWCAPCATEMPHIKELYKKYGSHKDFQLVGISLDGDASTLKQFLKSQKIDWPQVFGKSAATLADQFGVVGIPALFIVGPDGKILESNVPGVVVSEHVEVLLKKQATDD